MEEFQQIYDYLASNKCKDIAIYNVGQSREEGCIIVVTQSSSQANKKFANVIMSDFGLEENPEGYNNGEWILFDLGKFILHSFIPASREKYNLDRLWKSKKVVFDKK